MSTIAISQAAQTERPISVGDFWPEIDPTRLREAHRINGTVSTLRWRSALIEAAADLMGRLAAWRVEKVTAGYQALELVPADEIDDESILVHRYYRAIGALATANVTERYRALDTTGDGHRYADELETPIDDLRRDAHWAINDILGRPRSTIELI